MMALPQEVMKELRKQPSFSRSSPSPPALHLPAKDPRRVASFTSTDESVFSGGSSVMGRDSLGSNTSAGTSASRSSSASYSVRKSMDGSVQAKSRRRGYVRPQGTSFAKSAQSRESVLSLGSIAHLQYYFARTGLLDGKGGRLAKKKDDRTGFDPTALDSSFLSPKLNSRFDTDSSYASMGNSPELHAHLGGAIVESPTREGFEEYYSEDEDDQLDPNMLPPTVSTYNHREKPIERPPTLEELKTELKKTLSEADKVLEDVKNHPDSPPPSPTFINTSEADPMSPTSATSEDMRGWYELQGMHVLDIMTLAIRAAKLYYTAHDQPARLSAIKSERKIRADLLSVMEVLRKMATRNFATGVKVEERETMEAWVSSVYQMLKQEEAMEETERTKRSSWLWLDDTWGARSVEREYAFIKSMDPESPTLPDFKSVDDATNNEIPTTFLKEMSTGLRLVKLHNSIVKQSKRPFGAIEKWHTEFGKPYRSAENLIYWIKAAELRFEIILNVDVNGVVSGTDRAAFKGFEEAIWKWCNKVRQEITADLKSTTP